MRLPDFRSVIIDGVAFADAGGKAQSRYITAQIDARKAAMAKADPGALTAAERERLDGAEAKLAEAQAGHDTAVATWTDLRLRRWRGQHERSLINGVVQRVTRSVPTESDVSGAALAKEAAENVLQQTLIWRNKERQAVDAARWFRSRKAEGGTK